jgi:hypothetical protein
MGSHWMGDGRIFLKTRATFPLIKLYGMSLILAGSISLDSTFNNLKLFLSYLRTGAAHAGLNSSSWTGIFGGFFSPPPPSLSATIFCTICGNFTLKIKTARLELFGCN